jgi:hypothetical protein
MSAMGLGRVKTHRVKESEYDSVEMRPDDPTEGIKNIRVRKSEGQHTWTDDKIRQYRAYWALGTQQRLAMELALETTSRRADVTRIGPQHERRGKLDLRHTKNNVEAFIPITAELRAAIDACPTRHLTFLHTKAGAPRSPKALGGISGCGATLRACRNVARCTGSVRAARGVSPKREQLPTKSCPSPVTRRSAKWSDIPRRQIASAWRRPQSKSCLRADREQMSVKP